MNIERTVNNSDYKKKLDKFLTDYDFVDNPIGPKTRILQPIGFIPEIALFMVKVLRKMWIHPNSGKIIPQEFISDLPGKNPEVSSKATTNIVDFTQNSNKKSNNFGGESK